MLIKLGIPNHKESCNAYCLCMNLSENRINPTSESSGQISAKFSGWNRSISSENGINWLNY